jgi:spectinomycin phosphotransferase
MLDKPDLPDERLLSSLASAYGLRVAQLAFLPLGADVNTAVYRVGAADGQAYFLKLRRGPFDDLSVALPAFLASRGLAAVIAPLPTRDRQLAERLDPFTLALYPFVAGVDGYQAELSEAQWIELGATLKRLHAIRLPPAIRRGLPREAYSPRYRQRVQSFLGRASGSHFNDLLAAALAALLSAQTAKVQQLLAAAEGLARQLPARARALVLCHGDIHNGNVLLTGAGALYIVDWDTALLAPQERDLMFVGSGLGRPGNAAQEAAWFYQGYGLVEIDPAVVAYYRCERVVQDIEAFTAEILATTDPSPDRPQALRYLASQFEPEGVVDIALRSYAAASL